MSDDRDQIIEIINLYGLAVDARRWDLFDRIFTPDVEADYGTGRRWTDLASFKRRFEAAHEPLHHTQHAMANHLVSVQGDSAAAFTYVSFRLVRRGEQGDDGQEGSACYDDTFRRVAARWMIARRLCRITWRRRFQVPATVVEQMESELRTRQVKEVLPGELAYLAAG